MTRLCGLIVISCLTISQSGCSLYRSCSFGNYELLLFFVPALIGSIGAIAALQVRDSDKREAALKIAGAAGLIFLVLVG